MTGQHVCELLLKWRQEFGQAGKAGGFGESVW
jgi:hypothetical protein